MTELLPCPFCNAQPFFSKWGRIEHPENACHLSGMNFNNDDGISHVEWWNTRADNPMTLLNDGISHEIKYILMNSLKYRQTSSSAAPVKTGYSYAEVPDWQLKQWLEKLCKIKGGVG